MLYMSLSFDTPWRWLWKISKTCKWECFYIQ